MIKPLRIIVSSNEGEFMLLQDFPDTNAAADFARRIGFASYEITNEYNETEWQPLDASLDAEKVMSFAKKTDTKCQ